MTGIGLVRGLQDEPALFPLQVLHGEFVVDDRDDDLADVGVAAACSTTIRSPSWMPASIIESPFTRTSEVLDGTRTSVVVDA